MAKKVLIVEDHPETLQLIKDILLPQKLEVMEAWDGEEALKKISQNKPDLILLDIMLPGISGLDVFRELKGRMDTKRIPIIIVSVKARDPEVLEVIGDTPVLSKPFEPVKLIELVKKALV